MFSRERGVIETHSKKGHYSKSQWHLGFHNTDSSDIFQLEYLDFWRIEFHQEDFIRGIVGMVDLNIYFKRVSLLFKDGKAINMCRHDA